MTLPKFPSLKAPSALEALWWETTFSPLLRILKHAGYSVEDQARLTSFCRSHLIPTMSHTFPSFMTDDFTPMEMSLQPGENTVRFAIEPSALPPSPAARNHWMEILAAQSIMHPATDLEWFKICNEMLTLPADAATSDNQVDEAGKSQFFLGFDCSPAGLQMKAYFMPSLRASYFGHDKDKILQTVVERLGLEKPLSSVQDFFFTLPDELQPDPVIFAIDCLSPSVSRAKIYYRLKENSLEALEKYMTLDGKIGSEHISKGLSVLRDVWSQLFSNDAQQDVTKIAKTPGHFATRILIYYELKSGHTQPYPKAYLPVRNYGESDAHVARVMDNIHEKQGAVKKGEFQKFMRETFDHRDLAAGRGIQSYVTCAMKKDGCQVTSYFNPESFTRMRQFPGKYQGELKNSNCGISPRSTDSARSSNLIALSPRALAILCFVALIFLFLLS